MCIHDLDREDPDAWLKTPRGRVVHSVREPGWQRFSSAAHLVEIVLAPVMEMEFRIGEHSRRVFDAPPGAVFVTPANADSFVSWSSVKESAVVALEPSSLQTLAVHEEGADTERLEWPVPGTVDPVALDIAQTLKTELKDRTRANTLYVESLVTQLGVHILRRYRSERPSAKPRSRLSAYNAKRIQTFMKENFARKLTLAEMAAACELSPSHFVNSFTATFGQPPYRYFLNLRVAYAERLLVERDLTIAQVAYLCGFSSQSHLTSTMRKIRGETPFGIRTGK